jgi:hypothetical protein
VLFHWPQGKSGKGERRSPASSRLSATALHLSRHLRMKAPALLDLRRRGGVDHVGIVGRDLFAQPFGRVGQLVSVLMDRAALGRYVAPEGSQRLLELGRTTVPFSIKGMIASSASGRAFQASQSAFTFRRTRLTVSLLMAPPNTAESDRRTRRVLVPTR